MWGFYETQTDDVADDPIYWVPQVYGGPTNGVASRYKIQKIDGSYSWNLYFDQNNDQVYVLMATVGNDFSYGWAEGETGRRGSSVSAYDHHINLWSRNTSGVWSAWSGQTLDHDYISNYHWSIVSSNEYEVVHD